MPLEQLRAVMAAENVDAVALMPGSNLRKVTGGTFMVNERPTLIIVPLDGEPVAIMPTLEVPAFKSLNFSATLIHWQDADGYQPAFDAAVEIYRPRRLGVEGQRMRVMEQQAFYRASPEIEIVDLQAEISQIRLRKSDAEIDALQAAIDLSERALEEVIANVKVGMTEAEIRARLTITLFEHGSSGIAFGPIVAAGSNAAEPHAKARQSYRIQLGDALLFDFGGIVDGFNADITRTFFVGLVSDEDRALYEAVKKANEIGHATAGPGVTCHAVDDAVLTYLESTPQAEYILHKTGHGLGLDVHEDPYIMRGNHQILEPGMVFTNEPGLYVPGRLGVRIEDDVLVTPDGTRSLTSFPKELQIIG